MILDIATRKLIKNEPVVGTTYLVKHIFVRNNVFGKETPQWIPVIGNIHIDDHHNHAGKL